MVKFSHEAAQYGGFTIGRRELKTHAEVPDSILPRNKRIMSTALCNIVAKGDELMALCDELETQLTTTDTRRALLAANLQKALVSTWATSARLNLAVV